MSKGLCTRPGTVRDVHSGKDKESIVDIYVSAESLKVYDNPWVESTSPNVSGHAGSQHTGRNRRSMSNKFKFCLLHFYI